MKRQVHTSIERKFVWSIVWVGLIPMALAMVIGLFFSLETQRFLIQQSQLTAVSKTAQGVDMVIQGRRRTADTLSRGVDVREVLQRVAAGEHPELEPLKKRLEAEVAASGELSSQFCIFDGAGRFIMGTVSEGPETQFEAHWLKEVAEASFVRSPLLYNLRILAPVHPPEGGKIIGYVSETQSLADLIGFVLGSEAEAAAAAAENNHYEVLYLSQHMGPDDIDRRVYRTPGGKGEGPGIVPGDPIDPQLKARLSREPERVSNAVFLWYYAVGRNAYPVLLAYHRIVTEPGLYIVAYRSLWDAMAGIATSTILTILASGLVIGLFCIVGYRQVNNNIIRPLSLLNEGAQIIRQGDLELKLKIGTGDEIEELASSFNQMAAALRGNLRQLGESEEKYRSLITSMRDGIYQASADGPITFVNPIGAEIFGFARPEALIGVDLRTLFIEEFDYVRLVGELEKYRFVEHTRVWMKKEGGDLPRAICVEMSANRLFGPDGQVIGVEGTFRDVTQHVHLEQEARERSERIGVINQIANTINSSLEAGRVYEAICVEVRRLVHFDFASITLLNGESPNSETRQLFPEPPSGIKDASVQGGLGGLCAAWVAREGRYLVVEELRGHFIREEEPHLSPFAAEFPPNIHSCLCVPLHATGRVIGSLNLGAEVARSFTKHKIEAIGQLTPHLAVAIRNARLLENLQQSLEEVTLAREKLHDANEELKTLDEMKTNLLSNVSHELRTPLVSVMGYTDMLLHGKVGLINDMQKEYLQISMRNVEKLVTLIENLLDFSRLHRGTEEMVFDTFDLVDCARGSIQIIRPVADSRNIRLELRVTGRSAVQETEEDAEGAPTKVLVDGDKGKLGQVFNNLLSNAVKFNDNGGRIDVLIHLSDDMAEVSVQDTGIGIPEDAQDKVFTRFYQCDSSSTRKYGGTGIGLAIAQDIARLHGSRITVTSKPGEGSVFRFSLPLKKTIRTEGDRASVGLPSPAETHLLIELVTQDRALSSQIRSILVAEGMDVIHAVYPSAAISLANRYNPDCLLLDTESAPTGHLALEEIMAQPGNTMAPIILLTNDDDLYARYKHCVAARVKRGFRKSSLLSGIHYALSRGVPDGQQLGDGILCVDDDPEIVMFISRCLRGEGYQVDTCASGEDAIQRAASGQYWLVLLDVAMPGLDGWDVCRQIKSNAGLAGIKVYLVTAKPVNRDLPKLQEAGADGYILKPFKAEELLGVVQGYETRRPDGGEEAQGDGAEQ